jgi:catechol 2,3-dioxygenase-like lactoylglutathione lyase family enzyme
MTVVRMDNVLISVEDLDAAIEFFVTIGLEVDGRGPAEGPWVERVIGLADVRQEVAMLRTPDGRRAVELCMVHHPKPTRYEPLDAPANTLGYRRVMFAVDDIDATVARLEAIGGQLVGEVVDYEGIYRLCYLRGPEGIIVGLAQELG